jgi:hypothetical protein
MAQNENPKSPRSGYAPSGRHFWEEWDGQDSSVPDPPYVPEDDGLPSPHCEPGEQTWVEAELERRAAGEAPRHSLPGEPKLPHELPQPVPDYGLPPEVAEARRRQGLTGPPHCTGTGFFYRNGDEIPPTHPDHGPMHLIPRQQDGSFAAYYYCSKDELARGRIDTPPPRRHRRDGFSPERQEEFVGHLRGTASWTDAARLTGISRSTAYNLYNSPDAAGFRAAVDEALKCTDGLLEATALERAIKGHEEIVWYQGRRVGVRWKADNRLLMSLLRARNPLKYAPLNEIEGWLRHRGLEPPADLEGALDRLHAAEAEWGRRLPSEGAPAALPAASPALALEAPAAPASEPLQASISSTSAVEQPLQASTWSTLPDETPVQASISSTLPAAAPAAQEPGTPLPFRPPPRPRIYLAPS